MQRRHWMQASAAAAVSTLGFNTRLMAAPAGSPRMLVVFLRGGYDAMSLLVPSGSYGSFYREVRPNIAVSATTAGAADKPGVVASKGPIALNGDWGLHPALEASLMPLVAKRQAVFVPFAGTDDMTRSHFETQDSIELGQSLNARRDFGSGFLNRLAGVMENGDATKGSRDAIAFTDQLPLAMRGELSVANLSLKNDVRAGDDKLKQSLAAMYSGHALQGRVNESFDVRQEAARDLAAPSAAANNPAPAPGMATGMGTGMAAGMGAGMGMAGEQVSANRGAINAKGFELEARRIARLMRERYSLGFVDVGGWDTHTGQGAASGYLASRLEELGRGVAAYADELGEATWRKTVVVVLSEFGRTMRENGNRGTDHGHGSVYWVLGGSLAAGAGPVVGEQMPITAATLNQNRDLPVLNEYRSLLGGIATRQFGLSSAQLAQVFPGAKASGYQLI